MNISQHNWFSGQNSKQLISDKSSNLPVYKHVQFWLIGQLGEVSAWFDTCLMTYPVNCLIR